METIYDRDEDFPFGIDAELDYGDEYGYEADFGYEDYEPNPYDGTYSEE